MNRPERRSGADRRREPGRPVDVERRSGDDRRAPDEVSPDQLSLGRRLRQPRTIVSLVLPIILLILFARALPGFKLDVYQHNFWNDQFNGGNLCAPHCPNFFEVYVLKTFKDFTSALSPQNYYFSAGFFILPEKLIFDRQMFRQSCEAKQYSCRKRLLPGNFIICAMIVEFALIGY